MTCPARTAVGPRSRACEEPAHGTKTSNAQRISCPSSDILDPANLQSIIIGFSPPRTPPLRTAGARDRVGRLLMGRSFPDDVSTEPELFQLLRRGHKAGAS